jgi:hypothetical protein
VGARGRAAGATARATVEEKGGALAAQVEQVAPAVYWVPSQSEPDGFHLVTDRERLGAGTGLACDCAAARHHRACAHRAAVLARRRPPTGCGVGSDRAGGGRGGVGRRRPAARAGGTRRSQPRVIRALAAALRVPPAAVAEFRSGLGLPPATVARAE